MDVIKLKYSEPFIREAIRTYWWKQIGPVFPVITVLLAGYLIYILTNGDRSWVAGALGAVVILGIGIMVIGYFVHLHRALQRFRRMKTPEATLELGNEHFRVTSDSGSSEIKWSQIDQVWCFKNAWLLSFSAGEFMSLPVTDISPESKSFIAAKAKAGGAKIS
ncbi:MAG: YcxB family protein [Candidatus Nitronauta litoralis]|uniref:YcxB family protein n=1 Tax=Candidatus Nitronauta litoralis TaxID=2705533 RepID=A0A7T0BW38_9BACT|nr:MAG: YcxB family protein [Candidatus Nitronauta litoralis]